MRRSALRHTSPLSKHSRPAVARRCIQISSTPAASTPTLEELSPSSSTVNLDAPDAQFEVLGAPYSLLSASLSASQTLHTRRGTLVGVSGKPENAVSTLSTLSPLTRLPLGIPFMYQKITSASPITTLIGTRSPHTSFTTVHLDGTTDWIISARDGLLAWTGLTLRISPQVSTGLGLAHWGQSRITGRGLLALAGKGQVYEVSVRKGEEYIAHPSNVLAYSVNRNPPSPYRFKSHVLRLEVPGVSWLRSLVPDTKFLRVMRESASWQRIQRFAYKLRTWSNRTIWGDRLFLRFHGPTTILLQSRAARISDTLSARDANEIADVEPGALTHKVTLKGQTPGERDEEQGKAAHPAKEPSMSYVTVRRDTGEVTFENR